MSADAYEKVLANQSLVLIFISSAIKLLLKTHKKSFVKTELKYAFVVVLIQDI